MRRKAVKSLVMNSEFSLTTSNILTIIARNTQLQEAGEIHPNIVRNATPNAINPDKANTVHTTTKFDNTAGTDVLKNVGCGRGPTAQGDVLGNDGPCHMAHGYVLGDTEYGHATAQASKRARMTSDDDNVRGEAQHLGAGDHLHEQGEQGQHRQQHLHGEDDDLRQISTPKEEPKIKRKDFRIPKKRGIIPDGLVQMRLDSFLDAFPNLRGGAR